MSNYGFGKTVSMGFDEAVEHVTQELGKEGFGVLTEIDLAGTMKKKLDVDMRPYKILGACNPPLAHRAVSEVPDIGLLLPCNVVVREEEAGQVRVEAMDPNSVMGLVNHPGIGELASEVRARLERVLEAI